MSKITILRCCCEAPSRESESNKVVTRFFLCFFVVLSKFFNKFAKKYDMEGKKFGLDGVNADRRKIYEREDLVCVSRVIKGFEGKPHVVRGLRYATDFDKD